MSNSEPKTIAYGIADVEEILDDVVAERYGELSPPVIRKYGGRFITAGETVVAEGRAGKGAYLVIVEFPSMERAKTWYNSTEYAPIRALAPIAFRRRMLFVEGAKPSTSE